MFAPVFHISIVGFHLFSLWYDQQYVTYPLPAEGYNKMPFKARYMFLTYWCFILQTVYFSIAFLNDILGTNAPSPRKTPAIRELKDVTFSVAFPVAIYVSSTFWILYTIDKELVLPKAVSRALPVWLNHTLHTFISVFLLVEFLLNNRNYPSRKIGGTVTAVFSISYIVWLHILYERTGAWVYPIMAILNLPQRIVYFICTAIVISGYYLLGEKLNSILSGSTSSGEMKRKRR